jgi:hypothetical protein
MGKIKRNTKRTIRRRSYRKKPNRRRSYRKKSNRRKSNRKKSNRKKSNRIRKLKGGSSTSQNLLPHDRFVITKLDVGVVNNPEKFSEGLIEVLDKKFSQVYIFNPASLAYAFLIEGERSDEERAQGAIGALQYLFIDADASIITDPEKIKECHSLLVPVMSRKDDGAYEHMIAKDGVLDISVSRNNPDGTKSDGHILIKRIFSSPEYTINPSEIDPILRQLNERLQGKCPDLKLVLDRVYKISGQKVVSFLANQEGYILCLIHDGRCVSSLQLNFMVATPSKWFPTYIEMNSETDKDFLSLKYNTLLRCALVIIGGYMTHNGEHIQNVISTPTNPVSAYTLIKYFDTNLKKDFPGEVTFEEVNKRHEEKDRQGSITVDIASNIERAYNLFDELTKLVGTPELICKPSDRDRTTSQSAHSPEERLREEEREVERLRLQGERLRLQEEDQLRLQGEEKLQLKEEAQLREEERRQFREAEQLQLLEEEQLREAARRLRAEQLQLLEEERLQKEEQQRLQKEKKLQEEEKLRLREEKRRQFREAEQLQLKEEAQLREEERQRLQEEERLQEERLREEQRLQRARSTPPKPPKKKARFRSVFEESDPE